MMHRHLMMWGFVAIQKMIKITFVQHVLFRTTKNIIIQFDITHILLIVHNDDVEIVFLIVLLTMHKDAPTAC
jgi:hypothetical protein